MVQSRKDLLLRLLQQQLGLCFFQFRELLFQPLGNPLVLVLPRAFEQRLIRGVLLECVFELIARLG